MTKNVNEARPGMAATLGSCYFSCRAWRIILRLWTGSTIDVVDEFNQSVGSLESAQSHQKPKRSCLTSRSWANSVSNPSGILARGQCGGWPTLREKRQWTFSILEKLLDFVKQAFSTTLSNTSRCEMHDWCPIANVDQMQCSRLASDFIALESGFLSNAEGKDIGQWPSKSAPNLFRADFKELRQ